MSSGVKFSNVPEDTSSSLTASATWEDTVYDTMVAYQVGTKSGNELMRIFNSLVDDLKNKEASKTSHLKALVLAAHAAKPTVSKYERMITLKSGAEDSAPELNIPSPPSVAAPDYEDETVGTTEEKAEKKARNAAKRSAYNSSIRDPFKVDSPTQVKAASKLPESEANLKYACFLGSLLMKMVTKEATNVHKSWSAALIRFKGFYLEDIDNTVAAPSLEWLQSMKTYLTHDKKAVRTVVRITVSGEEQYTDPDSQEAGVIRFLFALPLAYTGMHAYKLFMAVKTISGRKNGFLLNALVHPKTTGGLMEIDRILRNYESRTGTQKSTKFRYARLIGPQYFMGLQTKQCPALVYCLVKVLQQYESDGDSGTFQPENIAGIQKLSSKIKTEMDLAAKLIANTLTEEDQQEYSPYMMQARNLMIESQKAEKEKQKRVVPVKDPFAV